MSCMTSCLQDLLAAGQKVAKGTQLTIHQYTSTFCFHNLASAAGMSAALADVEPWRQPAWCFGSTPPTWLHLELQAATL